MSTILPQVLSCRELVELITDYLEERLPPAERVRLEQHLLLCDGCSAYLAQLRGQMRATHWLAEESLNPGMRDKLLDAFRDWKRRGGAK